jgi:tetratricopeptide (TPR) repeat protein
LEPLPSAGVSELIDLLVGNHPDLTSLKDLLLKRTDGNPFFIEESVRSLVEIGALVGAKSDYRPGVAIGSIRIPGTVQTVVADRVDRLPAEEKQLLQTAAVIGVIVPLRLLRMVAGIPEQELRRALTNLQTADFLFESNLFPELEYKFKHALTNEVVYGALLGERRTALHGSIVRALEQMAGDEVDEYVEALAHHALRGELWKKAVDYLQQAGAKAMSLSAFSEALSSFEQAFVALGHTQESRERLAEEIDLHLDLRNVLFLLGNSSKVAEHLHAAESLAQTLGDRNRMVRVFNFLSSYYGLSGDPELAVRFGQRASALISESDGPQLSVMTDYYLGAAYNKLGQYSQAIDVLKRAIRKLIGDLRRERFGTAGYPAVTCRSHLIQCLTAMGQFREGVSYADEGIQIAKEVDDLSVLIYVNCSLAVLFLVKGDFAKSIEILESSLRICHSANVPVYVPYVASRLGASYAKAGRISEAIPYLEQGVEASPAVGRVAFLSLSTAWLSEGYLLCGRLQEANSLANRALDLSKEHKERGHEAWVLKLLGDIAMHEERRDTATAESYYRQAWALADRLAMAPLKSHCQVGLASVHAVTGLATQSRAELAAAAESFGAMGMTVWKERAEKLLETILCNPSVTGQAIAAGRSSTPHP